MTCCPEVAKNIVLFAFTLLARNILYTVDSHIDSPTTNQEDSLGLIKGLMEKKASATITYRLTVQVNAMEHHLTYVAGEKKCTKLITCLSRDLRRVCTKHFN